MAYFTRKLGTYKANIADTTDPNDSNGLLIRVAAYAAAVALIGCAASQNIAHGWQLGAARSETSAYILASGALAAAVMAPICLTVAFSERRFVLRTAAAFLALWCLAYGVTASLGFVSTAREAVNSERAGALEARHQAKARHAAAAAELAQLAAGKASRWKTERSAVLQRTMSEAEKTMQRQPAVTAVDPQATALAHYLGAAGFDVTAESVSTWTTAFTTAFYEVAGAFALTIARAVGGSQKPARPAEAPAPGKPAEAAAAPQAGRREADDEDDRDDPPAPRGRGRRGRPASVLDAEAIDRIRARGGRLNASLSGIGRLIGTKSKTTAHRTLQRLAAAGMITLAAGPGGMHVALA